MLSVSRKAFLRRRRCKTCKPNNCGSAITAIAGSLSNKPSSSGATVIANVCLLPINSCQFLTCIGCMPLSRNISVSVSLRPVVSAANNTLPLKLLRNCFNAAAASVARTSKASGGGDCVAKFIACESSCS